MDVKEDLHPLFLLFPLLIRLRPLDIEVMKRLGSRVNLIPVIAKADTLTPADLAKFKQNVSKKASFLAPHTHPPPCSSATLLPPFVLLMLLLLPLQSCFVPS